MARYAKINSAGAVVSIVVADAPFDGHDVLVPDDRSVGIGTAYANGVFNAPIVQAIAQPRPVTRVEFARLCMSAGGMTSTMLVQAKAAPELAAMWIILEMASEVQKDDPEVGPGLAALEALGYLPNGAPAVLDAWPTT